MELHVIKYCAEECERQGSGEVSVYDMCNAWEYASNISNDCVDCPNPELHDFRAAPITLDFIEKLGQLVEPENNKNGFRTIPIGVNDPSLGWIEKASWERIPDLLTALIEAYYGGNLVSNKYGYHDSHEKSMSAEDEFYYQYENIHPFRDGNGRTGKIIYNYLKGTLDHPIMPPNYWGGSNP